MKHFLLTTSILLGGALSAAAWNVETEPTRQSALIEEYTGIQCPNCPDGHRIAGELITMHPEDVYTVAIHAGSLAKPGPKGPNFVTDFGTALHDYFGISGYPTATVSRQKYNGRIILDRTSWAIASRNVVNTTSPVNLWSECSFDVATSTLTVNVEGYYTDNMADPRLTVMLLQSEIQGPQQGGLQGNEYTHRHMLRDKISANDLGDAIEQKTKGEYFSKTYTYVVPEAINDVPVDVRNIEVLAFVCDGDQNVRKASASRPDLSALEPILKLDTSAPYLPIGKTWGFDYVEMYINNRGTVDVTDADIDVTINGQKTSLKWTGSAPAHESTLIRVPLEGLWQSTLDNESNQYVLRLMKANGQDVETNSIRGNFGEIAKYPDELNFKIMTDMNAADNTYRILDRQGNVVKEFGPYNDGFDQEYRETVKLENDKVYCFEVTDSWGNGVNNPSGYVNITDKDNKKVANFSAINNYGMRQFFRTDATLGINDVASSTEAVSVEYIDLSGRKVLNPTAGIYMVRTTMADGSITTEKKTVK